MREITRYRYNFLTAGIAAAAISLASVVPAFAAGPQEGGGAPAAPATGAQGTGTTDQDYKISPEDVLEVFVVNRGELSKVVPVLPNGRISYPYVGELNVAGMTLRQVQQRITKALTKYYVRPEVIVSVRERQIRQVNVTGEGIRSPGKLVMRDKWRVMDALVAAGGIVTDRPEWVTAMLVQDGQAIEIDIAKLYANPDSAENRELKPNDTLIVKALPAHRIQVEVTGEVNKPGPVPAPRDGSINTVLLAVGNPTDRAALSRALINREGQTIPVDLRRLNKDGSTPEGVRLQGGDMLIIPRNEEKFAVVGTVGIPGEKMYPDDRKITVLEAWSQSGGVVTGADMKKVVLIRKPKEGAKEPETFNLRLDEVVKGDLSKDMTMEPGDVLYVPASGTKRRFGLQDVFSLIPTFGWIYSMSR